MPDPRFGRMLVLRDPQGIADGALQVPPPLVSIVARFDGTQSTQAIARAEEVDEHEVRQLVELFDAHGFLESPAFEARLREAQRAFDALSVRPAALAGAAYPGTAKELRTYIQEKCTLQVSAGAPIRALAAPHIDPWRGARGYGASYGALASRLDPAADTFLVLGTSHALMHEPFALCDKGYATPFGALDCDHDAVARLASAARFDPYRDRLNHQREHSIEFQAVFLRHLLGARKARIIPVLCGLGAFQASSRSPRDDADAARFLDAMAELVADYGARMVVVAGVDLAHVGPRFGDLAPDAEARAALGETDAASLARFEAREREEFWEHVAADLDTRKVCGLAPMYSLLWAIGEGSAGERVHYEQTVDADDGSVVSHAGVVFPSRGEARSVPVCVGDRSE